MAKKGLLKKIFGKSKQLKEPAKDANSIASGGGGNGRVSSTLSSNHSATAVAVPPAPQGTTVCDNNVTRSNSATLDTESDHSGSPRAGTKNISDAKVGEDAPSKPESICRSIKRSSFEDASSAKSEQAHSVPTTSDLENEDVAVVDAPPNNGDDADSVDEKATGQENEFEENEGGDADSNEKASGQENEVEKNEGGGADLDEKASGQENEVEENKGGDADSDEKASGQGIEVEEKRVDGADSDGTAVSQENVVAKKKDKKAWVEERISQIHSSPSSKPLVKSKIEVGHEFNVERRKWIEGLSSPMNKPSAPHVPDDAKKLGKLSDRMKAVEQAFHEKGKYSSPSKEVPAAHTPNRAKAAAQRKAVEDMFKRKSDSKAPWESKGKSSPWSPGKASAQRKAVEEMLQKQLDPNAFFESKGKTTPESSPGTERLTSRKKWVLETLEKQNDPKLFLDHKKDKKHTVGQQKEISEENKNQLEAKTKKAEETDTSCS